MAHDLHAARAVFTEPDERIPLDWYDGPVQAVYVHDDHGSWYVFALPSTLRERAYVLRPLDDPSVVTQIADQQTLDDDSNWLERLGREVLLPACAPLGFRVRTVGDSIEIEPMDEAELKAAIPRRVHAVILDGNA